MQPCEETEKSARRIVQRLEILQRRLQRVPFEKDAPLEIAEALTGRARLVPNDGARLIRYARTGDPRSPAEVDVLEICEIVVIKSAEREERFAARNHIAATREEQLRAGRRIVARRQRIAEAVLKRVAVEGQRAADEVDQLARRIDDLPADGDDIIRRALDRIDERGQPAILRHRVVVEENHVARRLTRQGRCDAAGETVVGAEGKQTDVRVAAGDRTDASVRRAVVSD